MHSPACILSFFITALRRGELQEAWNWTDEAPGSDTVKEATKGEEKQNGNGVQNGDVKLTEKVDATSSALRTQSVQHESNGTVRTGSASPGYRMNGFRLRDGQ